MHADREDDVSLDRHAHSSIEIVFTRNENSVRCKQREPYVSEKRKSVIKPDDFSFVKGLREYNWAQYIIYYCRYVRDFEWSFKTMS